MYKRVPVSRGPARVRDRLDGAGPAGGLRGLPDPAPTQRQAQHQDGDTQVGKIYLQPQKYLIGSDDQISAFSIMSGLTRVCSQRARVRRGGRLQDPQLLRHVRHQHRHQVRAN